MDWLLNHLGVLVFLFVLFSVVRASVKAARLSEEHKAGHDETEEQRRVREIQERIRRKIVERRGGAAPEPQPAETAGEPAAAPPVLARVPPLDPFGGPMRRMVVEMQRRTPEPATPPVSELEAGAVLERQKQLADQLRALEHTRRQTLRRATEVADAQQIVRESVAAGRVAARGALLADLRDATSLRRAIVLREVLGAPVGFR